MSSEISLNVENLSSAESDNDFATIDLTRKKKGNDFEKDSIVWAPWRNSYYPALVRTITKNKRELSVVYVDCPCDNKGKECRFKFNMRKVLKFDSSPKSKELYGNSLSGDKSQKDAIEKSHLYLYTKGGGKLLVEPIEFIKDPKKNLFANNTPEKRKVEEFSSLEQESDSDSDPESNIPLSTVKRRMAAKKVKKRTEQEEKFSELVMDKINSPACQEYLLGIIKETNESKRHKLFHSVTPSDKRLLQYKYGHILTGDQLETVICSLRTYMERSCVVPRSYIVNYPMDVWMPEALIFALRNLLNISKEQAETSLVTGKLP